MSDFKLLIGGALVPGDAMEVINPATGPFHRAARQRRRRRTRRSPPPRRPCRAGQQPFAERSKKLIELADAIAAGRRIRPAADAGTGQALAEAQGELAWTEGYLRHYATLGLEDRVIQDDAAGQIVVRHRPLGVVVGIIAWNFPLLVALWKIGPATLAGNAIVLKPAPTTPVAALLLGESVPRCFRPAWST
jgi:acyl-CoA reductase-like NAD-dependent aldehyde dehydrogenase